MIHLGRAGVGGEVGVLDDHLPGQEEDLVAEVAVFLAVPPEDAGHADVGEVAQAEINGPELLPLQAVRHRVGEPLHQGVVGRAGLVAEERSARIVKIALLQPRHGLSSGRVRFAAPRSAADHRQAGPERRRLKQPPPRQVFVRHDRHSLRTVAVCGDG
jgi:hypothetical protein